MNGGFCGNFINKGGGNERNSLLRILRKRNHSVNGTLGGGDGLAGNRMPSNLHLANGIHLFVDFNLPMNLPGCSPEWSI